jgi:hypothetical protein
MTGMREEPGHYELRVSGHLDNHWAEWFGDLTLTREPDGTTTLRGRVADQSALHGILSKIRDLGVVLISVRAFDAPRADAGVESATRVGVDT